MTGVDAVWQELEGCESRLGGVQTSCLERWRGPAALAAAGTIALDTDRLRSLREQLVDLGATLHEAATAPDRDAEFAARVTALTEGEAAPPTDPAAWWQALSPAERAELLRSRPAMLGGLDGLPATVRDQANRSLLASWLALPSPDAGLRALAERLRREPDALLLGLDRQGHAVLALGDPDRARDVCVYVPGVGTTLAGLAGTGADRARALADRLAQLAPGGGHSTIVWLGYDPPPAPGADPAAVSALGTGRADRGAPTLAAFVTGLRAANRATGGGRSRVTVLGHSYGSLTAARAAPLAPPDELVLVGSPGVGADRAADLGLPAEHVYVGQDERDPVANVASTPRQVLLPALTPALGAAAPLHLLGSSPGSWFGADPAGSGFGARRVPAAGGRQGLSAHSGYFEPDGPALDAVAHIVLGQGEAATRPPRELRAPGRTPVRGPAADAP